jgi:hypothetical protein
MSLVLYGSDGLSDVDGSAATPAIRGTDANTGIFFPAADTIAFAEGGTEAMRIDSSGNVGIGTTSPISKLTVNGGVMLSGGAAASGGFFFPYYISATNFNAIGSDSNGGMTFITGVSSPAVRATIDASGNLLMGTTSFAPGQNAKAIGPNEILSSRATTAPASHLVFYNPNGSVGQIYTDGTSTLYITSSDHRLKKDVEPMTGALSIVQQLKPVTYKWKTDGSAGQGFIAHELQEVCPDAVVGNKDAVDAEGKPVYQGIDTSFLVATLTAAIQEQQAIITALTARVEALEGTQP